MNPAILAALEFSSAPDTILAFIPIILIGCGTLISILAIASRMRRRDYLHKERILAMERGIQVMPMPEAEVMTKPPKNPQRYLYKALVLISVGVAWMLICKRGPDDFGPDYHFLGRWSYLPIAVGTANLLFYFLTWKKPVTPDTKPA